MNASRLMFVTSLVVFIASQASIALAQQMQKVSFKSSAANTKYVQQHVLDVGGAGTSSADL